MPNSDRRLSIILKLVGYSALCAFGAAVMPAAWIETLSKLLGIDPFPDSPLTFYLARNLSLMYGFVGAFLVMIASNLDRYRPLVRWMTLATIVFGILQLCVNAMAGLPAWWTLGESLSTIAGGGLLWFLGGMKRQSE